MAKKEKSNEKITYSVEEEIAVLSKNPNSEWAKELRKVSWNEKPAKWDIREWSPDGEKMSKGITLNDAELKNLKEALEEIDL